MDKMYKELFCKMKMRKLSQGEVAQQIALISRAFNFSGDLRHILGHSSRQVFA